MESIKLKPIKKQLITLNIKSTSPMIQHAWDDKAKRMMLEKMQGKKTKDRPIRVPEEDASAATYLTADGKYCIPGMALKSAIITAAHKDLGVDKVLVRKALFLRCPATDASGGVPMIPITTDDPIMREDCVRVGMGTTDLRYRPQFNAWTAEVTFEIDAELLQPGDLITLINRAGFGVGVGEWRPEKDGEFGRFEVDMSKEVQIVNL